MSKVITFSRQFPSYHPRKGEPTYFVEKIWKSLMAGDTPLEPYWMDGKWLDNKDNTKSIPWDYDPKHHAIRAGRRFKAGDWFSPRVWGDNINPKSGKKGPYHSDQITFAPDIQVKKVWDFELTFDDLFYIGKDLYAYSNSDFALEPLAQNDGLDMVDLLAWFNKPFKGQIICWNDQIEY